MFQKDCRSGLCPVPQQSFNFRMVLQCKDMSFANASVLKRRKGQSWLQTACTYTSKSKGEAHDPEEDQSRTQLGERGRQ